MGYTHYFAYDPTDPAYAQAWPDLLVDAVLIAATAARHGIDLAGPAGDGKPVFDAACGIALNGPAAAGLGFEPLRITSPNPLAAASLDDWCKTERLPYDVAVAAILLRFRLVVPDAFTIASDGDWDREWLYGAGRRAVSAGASAPGRSSPTCSASRRPAHRSARRDRSRDPALTGTIHARRRSPDRHPAVAIATEPPRRPPGLRRAVGCAGPGGLPGFAEDTVNHPVRHRGIPETTVGCALCRRTLEVIADVDGVAVAHGEAVPAHPPVPVPMTQILAPHLLCDHCSAPDPVWAYRTATVQAVLDGPVSRVHHFGDGYAACAQCAALIERDDHAGLHTRVVAAYEALTGIRVDGPIRAGLVRLQAAFWANLHPGRTPITTAAPTAPPVPR